MSDIPKARAAIKKLIVELRQKADELEAMLELMTRKIPPRKKEEPKPRWDEGKRQWIRRG